MAIGIHVASIMITLPGFGIKTKIHCFMPIKKNGCDVLGQTNRHDKSTRVPFFAIRLQNPNFMESPEE